ERQVDRLYERIGYGETATYQKPGSIRERVNFDTQQHLTGADRRWRAHIRPSRIKARRPCGNIPGQRLYASACQRIDAALETLVGRPPHDFSNQSPLPRAGKLPL